MVYDLYKLYTNDLKNASVCTPLYQLYIHSKASLIVTYDLILTLFDNIRVKFAPNKCI
jgi:hypothetical protein